MTSAVVYDLSQTAYLFSMVSNSVSDSLGTAPCLAQQLTDNVNKFIGYGGAGLAGVSDWTITWGPGVYQSPTNTSHLADNAAVVVFSPTLNTYILAIAGTNPQDCYDWLTEDIDVGPNALVNFPIEFVHGTPPVNVGVQGQSQVSLGTALGLYGVLQEMSGASLNTGFVQLQTYLATLTPGSGATLIVAGHSLGGALSAALGLQIQLSMVPSFKVTPMLGSGWTMSNVVTLSTAAPSPGNADFVNQWTTYLPATAVPASPYYTMDPKNMVRNFNQPVYDTLDVVPHAWETIFTNNPANANPPCYFWGRTILDVSSPLQSQVCPLTETADIGWVDALTASISALQGKGTAAGMTTLPNRLPFTGTFPLTARTNGLFTPYAEPAVITSVDQLAACLGNIHVWQYCQAFDITPQTVPWPTA